MFWSLEGRANSFYSFHSSIQSSKTDDADRRPKVDLAGGRVFQLDDDFSGWRHLRGAAHRQMFSKNTLKRMAPPPTHQEANSIVIRKKRLLVSQTRALSASHALSRKSDSRQRIKSDDICHRRRHKCEGNRSFTFRIVQDVAKRDDLQEVGKSRQEDDYPVVLNASRVWLGRRKLGNDWTWKYLPCIHNIFYFCFFRYLWLSCFLFSFTTIHSRQSYMHLTEKRQFAARVKLELRIEGRESQVRTKTKGGKMKREK